MKKDLYIEFPEQLKEGNFFPRLINYREFKFVPFNPNLGPVSINCSWIADVMIPSTHEFGNMPI